MNPRDTTHTVTDNYDWAKTGVQAHYCLRHSVAQPIIKVKQFHTQLKESQTKSSSLSALISL